MKTVHHTDVILHAFDWPYLSVAEQAHEIAKAGYKSVLVSPPMKSLCTKSGTKWWQRYQPQDYRVIDNQLGNTVDFKAMITALKEHDIRTYVDVVFNHMANESSIRNDLQYPSQAELDSYQSNSQYFESVKLFGDLSEPIFTEEDFVEAFGIEDWQDKWEVQNGRITGGPTDPGLPTLRDSDYVVEQQKLYLKAMKSLGVKGFRIDAAKHITLEQLKKVWSDDITEGIHIFGEIITDGGATKAEYELFLQPYLEQTRLGAYDFPLFQTVFDSLQPKGSLKSLIDPYCFGQALSKPRAITFAITHDIPNNDVFADMVMDESLEGLAYSYILGRDGGVPLIYTDLDTSGIVNSCKKPRWVDSWNDPQMVARIEFHNRMHGLRMSVIEACDDLLAFKRGDKGIVVLNKSRKPKRMSLPVSGEWFELLSAQKYSTVKRELSVVVPPQQSMMLVKQGALSKS
ncbi:alpha-amylase family protein [Vibrio sp. SCSIO 43135]|uniref:alpha-amylase family glycosyl hydrolase n=1 Tax=Vibrio sp. SCSIO 43135 TaxID=2819096 RepID=UPI0020759E20|nr:alpha-amylase family glycosyl hydrolase [Vibrio sp. SCSIO 43135]USD43915.1 alpha-amylase family protein [Vibrio sp. SCSIO 43135]